MQDASLQMHTISCFDYGHISFYLERIACDKSIQAIIKPKKKAKITH